MSKLTNKQRQALEHALYHLERAHKFLMAPDTAVARRCRQASTTLHYTRADGAVLYEIAREIGSDLVGLETGIAALRQFLNPPVPEPETSDTIAA